MMTEFWNLKAIILKHGSMYVSHAFNRIIWWKRNNFAVFSFVNDGVLALYRRAGQYRLENTALKHPQHSSKSHHLMTKLAFQKEVWYSKACSCELLWPCTARGRRAAGRIQLDSALTATLIRAGEEHWHLMRGVGDICSITHTQTHNEREKMRSMQLYGNEQDTHRDRYTNSTKNLLLEQEAWSGWDCDLILFTSVFYTENKQKYGINKIMNQDVRYKISKLAKSNNIPKGCL